MTREDAINDLKDFIDTYITVHGEEDIIAVSLNNVDVEAFRVAIKALEQQPCEDTISRQAAIKAICEDGTMLERQGKYTMTMAERKQKDADILDTLPPAQLAQDLSKGCTDTISRQVAIDALENTKEVAR